MIRLVPTGNDTGVVIIPQATSAVTINVIEDPSDGEYWFIITNLMELTVETEVQIRAQSSVQTVMEGSTTAEVCIVVSFGFLQKDINVTVKTIDGDSSLSK